jgi:uncharacterized protein
MLNCATAAGLADLEKTGPYSFYVQRSEGCLIAMTLDSIIQDQNQTAKIEEIHAVLIDFLASRFCPINAMPLAQVDGYIRGICCGPGRTEPMEWLPLVFSDEIPEFESIQQEEAVTGALIDYYNLIIAEVDAGECHLYLPLSLDESKDELEAWGRGFFQGYIFWQEYWLELSEQFPNAAVAFGYDNIDDVLDRLLLIISTVADTAFAIEDGTAEADIPAIIKSLPEAVALFGKIGTSLYLKDLDSSLLASTKIDGSLGGSDFSGAQATTIRFDPDSKTGRNDPCPCGSGKKFKKCCLH